MLIYILYFKKIIMKKIQNFGFAFRNIESKTPSEIKEISENILNETLKEYKKSFDVSIKEESLEIKKQGNILGVEYKIPKFYNKDFKEDQNWNLYYKNNNKKSDIVYITINKFSIPILDRYKMNYIYIKWFHENYIDIFTKLIKSWKKVVLLEKPVMTFRFDLEYWLIKESILNQKITDKNYLSVFNNYKEINSEKEFELISYEDTLLTGIKELENTDESDVFSWWYEDLDKKIWYIKNGELILVWGTTWTGKSTFVNNIAKKIGDTWNKVLKFTLEDRLEDKKKQEYLVELNKILRKKENRYISYNDFISNNFNISEDIKQEAIKNLIEDNKHIIEVRRNKEEKINIDELEKIVKDWIKHWCSVIIVDHLQEFDIEGNKDRHDLKIEEIMYKIKNITRKYNVLIFLIAHFKKIEGRPSENSFKDSIAISQVSNKVLLLYRDKLSPNSETELIIIKNREKWNWTWTVYMKFDFDTLTYTDIKINKDDLKNDWFDDIDIIF